MFLVNGWMKGFSVQLDDGETWTDEDLWIGKRNYPMRKSKVLE